MKTASGTGWRSALADIERAIGDCLAALDRYESAFARVLGVEPGGPASPVGEPPGEDGAGWDERLAAAGGAADAVERLLAEQEQVWGRWRAALADWRRLAGTDGTSPGEADTHREGGA